MSDRNQLLTQEELKIIHIRTWLGDLLKIYIKSLYNLNNNIPFTLIKHCYIKQEMELYKFGNPYQVLNYTKLIELVFNKIYKRPMYLYKLIHMDIPEDISTFKESTTRHCENDNSLFQIRKKYYKFRKNKKIYKRIRFELFNIYNWYTNDNEFLESSELVAPNPHIRLYIKPNIFYRL